MLKLKFGAIRGVVRGVVIFWSGFRIKFWDKIRHQIASLMSCGWVIILLLFQQITSLIPVLL